VDGEEAAAPRDPLHVLAKACIILGIVALVRFVPEAFIILPRRPDEKYFAVAAMDLLMAVSWLTSGLALRKRSFGALGFATVVGGLLLAHGATSGIFFGRMILKGAHAAAIPILWRSWRSWDRGS
jgi:hypothetical protein